MARATIWLAFGGNVDGTWGKPEEAFVEALEALCLAGLAPVKISHLYVTAAVGPMRQPDFRNAVVGLRGSIAPGSLLRLLKRLEARAGRRANGRWGRRPLDLDIIDLGGRIVGRPTTCRWPGRLVLPHPEVTSRGFVLVPLAEIAPHWRHPCRGVTAADLLRRNRRLRRGVGPPLKWPRAPRSKATVAGKLCRAHPSGVDSLVQLL